MESENHYATILYIGGYRLGVVGGGYKPGLIGAASLGAA